MDFVLRHGLDHDSTRLKVLEAAVLHHDVGVDGHDARSGSVVRRVAFQLAVDHLDRGSI